MYLHITQVRDIFKYKNKKLSSALMVSKKKLLLHFSSLCTSH